MPCVIKKNILVRVAFILAVFAVCLDGRLQSCEAMPHPSHTHSQININKKSQVLQRPTAAASTLIAKEIKAMDMRARMRQAMNLAVAAEIHGQWQDASNRYQDVVTLYSKNASRSETKQKNPGMESLIAAQALRSWGLMKSLVAKEHKASLSTDAQSPVCQFLGIDHTITSDWAASIGSEGWVLFARHSGVDLCGGPRILDHSFEYQVRLGDSVNLPRRWRSGSDWENRAGNVQQLADPAVAGEQTTSFLDDNGEIYPRGSGPDLYVDLIIPAGSHLLSFPLHFCAIAGQTPSYGMYLTDATNVLAASIQDNGLEKPSECYSSLIVSQRDVPGFVRASVHGPAKITLIVRRLDSMNANLPAVFLDPDPAEHPATTFSSVLPMAMHKGGAKTDISDRAKREELENSFKLLLSEYMEAKPDWPKLITNARRLIENPSLRPEQKSETAFIIWQAQEHLPLEAGKSLSAFQQFVSIAFPASASSDAAKTDLLGTDELTTEVSALQTLEERLRTSGRIRFAEVAANALWNARIRLALRSPEANEPPIENWQNVLVNNLWTNDAKAYLASQDCWLWSGLHQPVRVVHLTIDADYASRKAQMIVQAKLCRDFTITGFNGSPKAPVIIDERSAIQARGWIDNQVSFFRLPKTSEIKIAPSFDLTESTWAKLFIVASQPLLGSADPTLSKEERERAGACRLRPDQLELLAKAWLERDIFPTDRHDADALCAQKILTSIITLYPDYPFQSRVKSMLVAMGSAPVNH